MKNKNHRTQPLRCLVSGAVYDRGGITIIEVLVCLGVIGLLMAITVPAVQQARAASQRMECLNHLRQIGLAVQNYSSLHDVLPGRMYSPFGDLLAQLELVGPTSAISKLKYIPRLRCPSDRSEYTVGFPAQYSYLMNGGSCIECFNGVVPPSIPRSVSPLRFADITDGTSHTALFGERKLETQSMLASTPFSLEPHKYVWHLESNYTNGQEVQFHSACIDSAQRTSPIPSQYLVGRNIFNPCPTYFHLLPPNAVSCYWSDTDVTKGANQAGLAITSNHANGANIVLCDGHARFVSSQIDIRVWRSVGSRNGSDSTGDF